MWNLISKLSNIIPRNPDQRPDWAALFIIGIMGGIGLGTVIGFGPERALNAIVGLFNGG